jgi:hypothetical protein
MQFSTRHPKSPVWAEKGEGSTWISSRASPGLGDGDEAAAEEGLGSSSGSTQAQRKGVKGAGRTGGVGSLL